MITARFLNYRVKQKLDDYVSSQDGKIQGLLEVLQDRERFLFTDFAIFDNQISTSASITLDSEEGDPEGNNNIIRLYEELRASGKNINLWKGWWHSHDKLSVFCSGTDCKTAESFGSNAEWMITLVANKKKEYYCRLEVFKPCHITVDKIQVLEPEAPIDQELSAMISEEVKRKVRKPTIVQHSGKGYEMWEKDANGLFKRTDNTHYADAVNRCPSCNNYRWSNQCKCETTKDTPPMLSKRQSKKMRKIVEAYESLKKTPEPFRYFCQECGKRLDQNDCCDNRMCEDYGYNEAI